jgi:hypothetical protein
VIVRRLMPVGLAFLIFGLLSMQSANAACSFLLDVSGSMAGFRGSQPRPIEEFNLLLDRLQSVCRSAFKFGDRDAAGNALQPVTGKLRDVPLNHQRTLLGSATEAWFKGANSGDSALVLTDNVADMKDPSSATEQILFNKTVTNEAITALVAIPIKLPFSGTIFHPSDGKRKASYGSSQRPQPRAVVLYVIGKRALNREFDALAADVGAHVEAVVHGNFESIRVRPLAETLEKDLKLDVESIGTNSRDTKVRVARAKPDGPQEIHIVDHDLGASLEIKIPIQVQVGRQWDIVNADVDVQLQIPNQEKYHLTRLAYDISISPKQVKLQGGKPVDLMISMTLKEVDYLKNADFWTILQNVLGTTSVDTEGKLIVTLSLARAEVSLGKIYRDKWNLEGSVDQLVRPDEDVQTRIFNFDPILQSMVRAGEQRQASPTIFVLKDRMLLPSWPIFVAIIFALALLGLLGVFAWLASRPQLYLIQNDVALSRTAELGWGDSIGSASADGSVRIAIRRWPYFLSVTSGHRIARGRWLNESGGHVVVWPGRSQPLLGRLMDKARHRIAGFRSGEDDATTDLPKQGGAEQSGAQYEFRVEQINRDGGKHDDQHDI